MIREEITVESVTQKSMSKFGGGTSQILQAKDEEATQQQSVI